MGETQILDVKIVSVSLGKTSSGKRMWRCRTGGDFDIQINIFDNSHVYNLFAHAGYQHALEEMNDGDVVTWHNTPIEARVSKSGKWWNFEAVTAKLKDASPDDTSVIQAGSFFQRYASEKAKALLSLQRDLIIWDVETTGFSHSDDIVSIGAVYGDGTPVFVEKNLFIKPSESNIDNLNREEVQSVHGITYEFLMHYSGFKETHPVIHNALHGKFWCMYNSSFDEGRLRSSCFRYGLPPIVSKATIDAMPILNDSRRVSGEGSIKSFKLVEIATLLGVEREVAHDAYNDSLMTYKALVALANL